MQHKRVIAALAITEKSFGLLKAEYSNLFVDSSHVDRPIYIDVIEEKSSKFSFFWDSGIELYLNDIKLNRPSSGFLGPMAA